jgi:hypothetical protein
MEKQLPNGWSVVYPEGQEPEPDVPAENFVQTLNANIDNDKVSDTELRDFIRDTLPIVIFERPGQETK